MEVLSSENSIVKELRECKQELESLRCKIAADDLWRSTVEHFLLTNLGYDVQKALKEKQSLEKSAAGDSSARLTPSSGTSSLTTCTFTFDTTNLRLNDEFTIVESSGKAKSSLASTTGCKPPKVPRLEPEQCHSFTGEDELVQDEDEFIFPTLNWKDKKLLTLETSVNFSDMRSSGVPEKLTDLDKLDTDCLWSDTPTFPLSQSLGETSSCSTEDTQGREPYGALDFENETEIADCSFELSESGEIKFQDVESKIREICYPGRKSKVYQCIICRKTITQRQNARFHVRRVHFGERIKCEGCRRGFYDKRTLNTHYLSCFKYMKYLDDRKTNEPSEGEEEDEARLNDVTTSEPEPESTKAPETASTEIHLQGERIGIPCVLRAVSTGDPQVDNNIVTVIQSSSDATNPTHFEFASDKIMVVEIAPEYLAYDESQIPETDAQ